MARKILHLVVSFAIFVMVIGSDLPSGSSFSMLTAIVVFNATEPGTGNWKILRTSTYSSQEDVEMFGKTSRNNVSGLVYLAVAAEDHDCGFPDVYKNVDVKAGPWIALVELGHCTSSQRVKEAESANASGVIMYDALDNPIMIPHERNGIIAVSISRDLGWNVLQQKRQGNIVTAQISLGQLHLNQYARGNKTSIIFVSISFLILMVISLAWVIVYYIQRFRIVRSSEVKRSELPKKFISKLPKKILKEGDNELECEEICPICIDIYKAQDVIRILPCQHIFHSKCVDSWLKLKVTCPMCKYDLLKSANLSPSSSEAIFVPRSPPVVEVWELEAMQQRQTVTPTSTDSLVPSATSLPYAEGETSEDPGPSDQIGTDVSAPSLPGLATDCDGPNETSRD